MRTINGYISDPSGVPLPGIIIASQTDPYGYHTSTNSNGEFSLAVPDSDDGITVIYTDLVNGGQKQKDFTIPTPIPAVWNITIELTPAIVTPSTGAPESGLAKVKRHGGKAVLAIAAAALALLLIRSERDK